MKELFIQYAMPPILTALGLGVAWLLTAAGQWLLAKNKDSKFNLVVARVTHFAAAIVQDVENTLRPQIGAALADGVLSPEEAKQLKDAAMSRLKTMLGTQGVGELTGVLGVFAPSVDAYLSGVIEKTVTNMKAAAPPNP